MVLSHSTVCGVYAWSDLIEFTSVRSVARSDLPPEDEVPEMSYCDDLADKRLYLTHSVRFVGDTIQFLILRNSPAQADTTRADTGISNRLS